MTWFWSDQLWHFWIPQSWSTIASSILFQVFKSGNSIYQERAWNGEIALPAAKTSLNKYRIIACYSMLKLNSSLSPVIVIFPKISQCTALIPGKKNTEQKSLERTNLPRCPINRKWNPPNRSTKCHRKIRFSKNPRRQVNWYLVLKGPKGWVENGRWYNPAMILTKFSEATKNGNKNGNKVLWNRDVDKSKPFKRGKKQPRN